MTETAETLIADFKRLLQDNDGELSAWGEKLKQAEPPRASVAVVVSSPKPLSPAVGKKESLEQLRAQEIGDCKLCPLSETRIKLVFGVGNPETEVMFIGEGPGYDEDRQGEPFVGKAGQLLDKIMAAINLDRSKVYIANIVKCHPMVDPSQPEKRGNDRAPELQEIAKCLPFLQKQIEIVAPKFIVTLGATATRALLSTSDGITRLRGKLIPYKTSAASAEITVLPTYHPAALLRNPELKRDVWEDMKKLRSLLSQ